MARIDIWKSSRQLFISQKFISFDTLCIVYNFVLYRVYRKRKRKQKNLLNIVYIRAVQISFADI